MKARLEFDLNDEEDAEEFTLMGQAQDYKDAFQDVWKYVRDTIKYSPEHTMGWNGAFLDVEKKIVAIANDHDVEVW